MNEKDVYQFYTTYVKPIYSEIEARDNTLPVELLFETYAAFDHLKRYHTDKNEESKACEKALSHLKRGVLDAFKLKLVYFNEDVSTLLSCDLGMIDNGQYLINFLADKKEIMAAGKEARLLEARENIESAFEPWIQAALKIDAFEKKYLDDRKIGWAANKMRTYKIQSVSAGMVLGVIASLIAAAIMDPQKLSFGWKWVILFLIPVSLFCIPLIKLGYKRLGRYIENRPFLKKRKLRIDE